MKRLILSADNRNATDESYIKYCSVTVQGYAKLHNYQYVFNQIGKVPDNRHPAWARIPLFFKYLNDYDEILWLDTDVIVWNQSVDLFEYLKTAEESEWRRNKAIKPVAYTVVDYPTNNSHACSGIVLIDCSDKERVKQFLNDWWNDVQDDKYKTEFPYDQSVWNNVWIHDITKSSYLRVANIKTSGLYADDQPFIHLNSVYGNVRYAEAKKFYMNLTNPHKYRIGIFVRQQNYYSNGVGQNAIFLKQAFESTGRMVDLIVMNPDVKKQFVSDDIKYSFIDEATLNLDNYDIFVCGSFIPPIENIKKYKSYGIKVISFNPVNVFDAFHHETFLYKEKSADVPLLEQRFIEWADEIWVTEYHAKSSLEYLETLNLMKIPVKSVPHVWNDLFIKPSYYQKRNTNINDIVILEPNMSYAKSAWYSLMIAERLYLTKPESLGNVYLFNTPESNPAAMKMIHSLQIAKNNKIKYYARLQANEIYAFFSQSEKTSDHNVVILSHTINVPMNYVYYEALKLGFPLVHNSPVLRDLKLGSYYEGLSDGCARILEIDSTYDPEKERLNAAEFLKMIEPYNTTTVFDKLLEYTRKYEFSDLSIPLVITYDNEPAQNTYYFIKTMENNKWEYKLIGKGEKWEGWRTRMIAYVRALSNIDPKKIVVLSDARDVFCIRGSKSFIRAFESFKKPVVASMELFCEGLDFWQEGVEHTQCMTLASYWKHHNIIPIPDRKFVNNGLIAGYAQDLKEIYQWMYDRGYTDDQFGLGNYVITFPDKVATDCDAKLLHSSTFGVNAGVQYIHKQANDSPTLAELYGNRAYFLHISGIANKGQKQVYEQVKMILDSGFVRPCILTEAYKYPEPDFDECFFSKTSSKAQSLGGYFQCYKNPVSFLRAIESFQKYYPGNTIVVSNDGGNDYSAYCKKHRNIHYTFYPKTRPPSKQLAYSTPEPILDFLGRLWNSFPHYKETHILLLEDDVRVMRHHTLEFTNSVNGMNTDWQLFDPLQNMLKEKGYNGHFFMGGCGGCVLNKEFFQRIPFSAVEALVRSVPPISVYASDVFLSFIAMYYGGSVGSYGEFAEMFYPNINTLLMENKVAFLHQYKQDYNTELSETERNKLYPS